MIILMRTLLKTFEAQLKILMSLYSKLKTLELNTEVNLKK